MSVARFNLESCIGCGTCASICPMDCFYMNEDGSKSYLAYPDNCQSCGQCYLHCPTDSLMMAHAMYGYSFTPSRCYKTWTELIPVSEGKSW